MRRHVRSLLAAIVALNALNFGPLALTLPQADAADSPESQDGVAVALDPAAVTGTVLVTTTDDQWDPPNNTNNQCSLREAIEQAGGGAGGRGCKLVPSNATVVTLNFETTGTYVLTKPDEMPYVGPEGRTLIIDNEDIVIDGNMYAGRSTGIFRIAGGTLKLTDLTLQHGSRPFGGAIYMVSGTLDAEHVTFKENGLSFGANPTNYGGAISLDTGALTVNDSLFQDNQSALGGGAFDGNFGIFKQTKFIGNESLSGGAVLIGEYENDPVEFNESEFKDNKAVRSGSLPLTYTAASDMQAGGAIQNFGHLRLYRTLVTENQTTKVRGGGGLSNEGTGNAVLEECVFSKNKALLAAASAESSWGGAIFNGGVMDIIRCSIHGNESDDAGGIFNGYAGDLQIFNSTISNNTAKFYGALVNEHSLFNSNYGGATVHLFHTTIGPNTGGNGSSTNFVHSAQDETIWVSNSVIDTGCYHPMYTYGRSVMRLGCDTVIDPQHGSPLYADISNTVPGLLGLTAGTLPVPQFMVQPLVGNSPALNIGRDDVYGCGHPLIDHKDQNLVTRGVGDDLCDAGALEGGTLKPVYTSNPTTGLIQFPVVSFLGGPGESTVNLGLSNAGGGALEYEAQLEDSPAITLLSPPSGVLFQNQAASLQFRCSPPGVNDYWAKLLITTNGSNKKKADYKLRCTGAGEGPQVSTSEPEGPLNLPPTAPGQTGHSTLVLSNNGTEPLNVNGSYQTPGGPFGSSGLLAGVQGSGANTPQTPAGGPWTLPPGQSVTINLSCAPTAFGFFTNTFKVTTSDLYHPSLSYPMGCEGLVTSPPEDWQPGQFYPASSGIAGLAISPDGQTVLAGHSADENLRVYKRDSSTGALTIFATPGNAGMTQIYGTTFSHDGRNVYYTSLAGDGVVVMNRNGPLLSTTQVLTSGTRYACSVPPLFFCTFDTMDGAHSVAVSPDDQYVYVTGFIDGSLTVFQRDLGSGMLTFTQHFTRTINGVNVLGGANRIAVSPDGQNVYVAAGVDKGVAIFERLATGRLSYHGAVTDTASGPLANLDDPEDLALSPDGQFLYVTAYLASALNIFQRGSADGQLTPTGVITGVTGAWGVAVSPDENGERVYVAARSGDQVVAYARNPVTGALSLIRAHSSNLPSSNLNGPMYFAASPDNLDVYVSLYDGQGVRLLQTIRHQPVLTSPSPASLVAGSDSFSLTVRGGRFYPDSKIVWGATPLATQFISENELAATVPAALVTAVGSANVLVRSPAPGGGDSAALSLAIQNANQPPIPSIESVDPPEASFGFEDLLITITGDNFTWESQVTYNGQAVPTVFFDDTTLQATLSADVLQAPGTGGLAVINYPVAAALQGLAAPNSPVASTTSRPVGFKISPANLPALPAVSSVAPASVLLGSDGQWITVLGHNFSTSPTGPSEGRWNGQPRLSVVMDAKTLVMLATPADLALGGTAMVSVFTPGAGESEAAPLKIRLIGDQPVPVLVSVGLNASSKPMTLLANGSDFVAGAQIRLNGVPLPTTFINSYRLATPLPSGTLQGVVTVFNPGPGGGLSNPVAAIAQVIYLPVLKR